jgi:predicted N-acetyltransferase YhbS
MTDSGQGLVAVCVDERAMTPGVEAAIRELLCTCFPDAAWNFAHTRAWHGSGPEYSIVSCEGDRAIGHVGVVVREIACDGVRTRIAGVQNVAVHPERRRSGLSRLIMRESMQEAERRGIPFGVLFCVPGLENFYHSLGWYKVEARVTMLDETGADAPTDPKNIMMVKQLGEAPFTATVVHLLGADW